MNKMENSFDKELRLERARKHVKAIKGFYKHLAAFILVNAFLWIVKFTSMDASKSFFEWENFITFFFWGIGLFFHWYSVFKPNFIVGKDWEERKIKELMDRERSKRQEWE